MADLTSEFIKFHEQVSLNSGKKEALRKARDAVRDRIRKYFRENLKVKLPNFFCARLLCNGDHRKSTKWRIRY
jgi:hypothetical protein